MNLEYVKIAPSEQTFGEANLLQAQISILTMLKQYHEYKTLRKEELFLKIELKKKINEAKEFLSQLSRLLPESRFLEHEKKKEKMQKELMAKIERAVDASKGKEWKYWKEKDESGKEAKQPKKSSIDKELDEIRQKLEMLENS